MRSESFDHPEKDIYKQLKKSNYYEILDVKNNASDADIKKSFKKMALQYHPDKNSASYSKQVFHKISQAYDTLSDPFKRGVYDQKQDKIHKKKQSSFSKSNTFFYDSSNFNPAFSSKFQQKSPQFEKQYAHWSTQFKMDERARSQRQWFRKQRDQKQKDKENKQNQSFRPKANSKNSSFQKPNTSEKKQKQSWQDTFKKQSEHFNFFQKSFSKRASQNNSSQFEEIRRQIQRKQRLQKQKQRADKNIRTFMLFVLVVIAWLTFEHLGPTMKGIPVYSMQPSQAYRISRFTKELHSPFYVTTDYVQRAHADERFREYLDRKIDVVYIKSLSRVCNTMIKKQEELYSNLNIAKSKKSRKSIKQQLQHLDMLACDRLHDAREMNPQYFKGLFLDPRNREQI